MRYLFFDIECSDGKHICSFGYVITDTSFNVLKKEDIVINPEARFQLGSYSGGDELKLAYPRDVFRAAKPFKDAYPYIATLFAESDQMVFGHAVDNDAYFLNIACERYGLPQLSYKYVDSQVLYKTFSGIKQQSSLEKIMADLGVPMHNDFHKSSDDAEMSMLTVKLILKKTDSTIKEFLELCPSSFGETADGKIVKKACGGERKNFNVYFCRIGGLKPTANIQNPLIKNKRFCISSKLEKSSTLKIWSIVQDLVNCGGKYTKRTSKCDFFVRHTDKECGRLRNVEERLAKHADACKIITLDELLTMLGTTWADVMPFDVEAYLKQFPLESRQPISHIDTEGGRATIGDIANKRQSKK